MNDGDRIIIEDYFAGKVAEGALSETQAKILRRIDYADNLLVGGDTDKQCATKIRHKFDVSMKTAYEDIHLCKMIHKSRSQIDKDYEKSRLLDMNLRALKWAESENNLKEYNMAIITRMKILGIDKEKDTKDYIDPTLLQQNIYNMVLNFKEGPQAVSLKKLMDMPVERRTKQIQKITGMLIENDVKKILEFGSTEEEFNEDE